MRILTIGTGKILLNREGTISASGPFATLTIVGNLALRRAIFAIVFLISSCPLVTLI